MTGQAGRMSRLWPGVWSGMRRRSGLHLRQGPEQVTPRRASRRGFLEEEAAGVQGKRACGAPASLSPGGLSGPFGVAPRQHSDKRVSRREGAGQ